MKREFLPFSKLKDFARLGKEYDLRLKKNADAFVKNKVVSCKTKAEIKKTVDNGKIAKVNFCSVQSQGVKCAGIIEKDVGASVRGTLANKNEKPVGNCVICNAKAEAVVYIAKSY